MDQLRTDSVGNLIRRYSLPAIISSLISSIYNIVDQMFVGMKLGELGNAATNVAFPLVMLVTTLAMTFGVGSAAAFSLYMGEDKQDRAGAIVGNGLVLIILGGTAIMAISLSRLQPLLVAFGGRGQTLTYALEYTRILALGFPFASIGTGASQLVRADGSPRFAMVAMLSGAIMNCVLDPVLIFGLDMGMQGAALATILGQATTAIAILLYCMRFRSCRLTRQLLRLRRSSCARILELGVAAGANQLAVTAVQIVMNNVLGYYGELSRYGRDIPLACVGIITKVSSLFNGVIFGISQSVQPALGYNYGACDYKRVREIVGKTMVIVTGIAVIAFICFQCFPRQIMGAFGKGSGLYYEFGIRYFRIFLCGTFAVGVQMLCAQFFPSIGKGVTGIFVSLSRQVIILLPLIVIFPMIWGIDGILWAGPIADIGAAGISLLLLAKELKRMR